MKGYTKCESCGNIQYGSFTCVKCNKYAVPYELTVIEKRTENKKTVKRHLLLWFFLSLFSFLFALVITPFLGSYLKSLYTTLALFFAPLLCFYIWHAIKFFFKKLFPKQFGDETKAVQTLAFLINLTAIGLVIYFLYYILKETGVL